MRRIRFTTVLLLLVFCMLPIISILMMHHLTLSDTLSKMSTGSFGGSYSCVSIKDAHDTKENLINILNGMKVNYALCLDRPDESNGTIRAFYFNKKYANLPMESGRFFKASDFTKDNYVAVVGKGRKNEIYINDRQKYITVNEKEYLVLGIIGYQDSTVIDDYIFVNMLTATERSMSLYLIDYYTSNVNTEDVTERGVNMLIESGVEATIMTMGENYSESIMPSFVSARWFIALLVGCFICLVLVSVQWINYQKDEFCIRRLIGASVKNIVYLIIGKYLAIAIAAFIVGSVYCHILYPAYFQFLLNGYMICLVFIAFFILWSVFSVLQKSIAEAIK